MQIQVVSTKAKFDQFIEGAWGFFDVLSCDIETGGDSLINPRKGRIVSVSLTNGNDESVVLVFNHPESELKNADVHSLGLWMVEQDSVFLTWNGSFDLRWLAHHSVGVEFFHKLKAYDVKLMARNNFKPPAEGSNWYNDLTLKKEAIKHLGVEPWADIDFKNGERADTTPIQQLVTYNAKDTLYTARLYDYYSKQPSFSIELFKIQQAAWLEIVQAEYMGIPLNTAHMQSIASKLTQEAEEAENKLFSLAEELDVHVNKRYKKSLAPTSKFFQLFMRRLFGEPRKFTENGAPSWDKSVLKSIYLEENDPLAGSILETRSKRKAIQFLDSWRNDSENNRLYPNYRFDTTRTGRLSCRNPNFQQVPRDARLRQCFGFPPESEFSWIEADYSQIELRVAAYVYCDREMQRAFEEEKDLHQLLAAEITGLDPDECTGEIRTKAKIANFGFLYGMQATTFVDYAFESYGVRFTLSEAQRIRHAFFSRWPDVAEAHKRLPGKVQEQGFIEGLFGRIHFFPYVWGSDEEAYKAFKRCLNYPIQAGASDILMKATPQVGRVLRNHGGYLIANIHDALCGAVLTVNAETAAQQIKAEMESTAIFPEIPLKAEVSVGKCWYENG